MGLYHKSIITEDKHLYRKCQIRAFSKSGLVALIFLSLVQKQMLLEILFWLLEFLFCLLVTFFDVPEQFSDLPELYFFPARAYNYLPKYTKMPI